VDGGNDSEGCVLPEVYVDKLISGSSENFMQRDENKCIDALGHGDKRIEGLLDGSQGAFCA
jgi:hypothetical protein